MKKSIITLGPEFACFPDPSLETDLEKTTDLNKEFGRSINGSVGQHAFAQMEENPDIRKKAVRRTTAEQRLLEHKRR